MRRIARYAVEVTSGADGAGTATTPYPISGEVVEIRVPNDGTALMSGGTADLTVTRDTDGGTVFAGVNLTPPFQYAPRPAVHTTTGGTTNYAAGVGPVLDPAGVPVDDYLTVVVAQGLATKSATVYIHVREGN